MHNHSLASNAGPEAPLPEGSWLLAVLHVSNAAQHLLLSDFRVPVTGSNFDILPRHCYRHSLLD